MTQLTTNPLSWGKRRRLITFARYSAAGLLLCLATGCWAADAAGQFLNRGVQSRDDLEYGAVLFEYFQQHYFEGLVEQAYATAVDNSRAKEPAGQLLKGSMALSYGMPETAEPIFDRLLSGGTNEDLRNRAWFYLAKLYYSRSKPDEAYAALEKIRGNIPADLHLDYHYLATLVNNDGQHLRAEQEAIDKLPAANRQYPYLLFNLGVAQLQAGYEASAIRNLNRVVSFNDGSEELQVLSDRARHGLAQIAMQEQQLPEAWSYLQDIRTRGLYSSRALLAYAWTAIRQKLFQVSLPALQLLNQRSIALPEVQEGKVLLGHVYEQQGSTTRALKSHLQAEKDFEKGLQQLAEARRIIDQQDVPREFITNLDAIVDQSDWYTAQPSLDYKKLTPFLVDLMASNAFHQVLRELAELYAIRDNLDYWARQAGQHKLILRSTAAKAFDKQMRQSIKDSAELHERLDNQRRELALMTLTFEPDDQKRFKALLENSNRQLNLLDDTLRNLQHQRGPYRQPPGYATEVDEQHRRITARQRETDAYIARLEPVMRNLVKAELDKHEERMRYYLAQTRLAKARLYDTALTNLKGPGAGPAESGGISQ